LDLHSGLPLFDLPFPFVGFGFRIESFGVNHFPIIGFPGKSVVIRVMFFQTVIEFVAMAGVEFINFFGVYDVKVKHSTNKKGSGKRPTLRLCG
jgi:hypothetical protein